MVNFDCAVSPSEKKNAYHETNFREAEKAPNRVVGLDLTNSLLHFANDNDFSAKESQIVDTRFPRVGHLRCLLSEEDT